MSFKKDYFYRHKINNEIYQYIKDDSDRPHPDVVVCSYLDLKQKEPIVMSPDLLVEIRDPGQLTAIDVDRSVFKDMIEAAEEATKGYVFQEGSNHERPSK